MARRFGGMAGLAAALLATAAVAQQAAPMAPEPVVAPLQAAGDAPLRWDPAAWSQEPTECDRLAAHPSDPDRLTAGVSQPAMLAAGIDTAIAACRAAVAADPANPRLNYQLARTLGYAGRGAEAAPFREVAVAGDYPQGLFVVGFVHLTGQGAPRDPCKAGYLIRRSAQAGRFAGLVGFPSWSLAGQFQGCPQVRVDLDELDGFLLRARAHPENNDFYRGLLIDTLQRDVAAARAGTPRPF